ncbi:hypothetical protein ADK52_33895 [Streptomyces sp. WM6372]|uniref:hypothetical protein n=1 Tax=Streptomyces sp. WM6372 TaxID=1415555 RepID=UPI0006AEDEEC|nr:hypothetical protein [Streptomyces sp. WM6372]KOU16305.1 hypothetical protein ADK52_33895 [Streptomyces sp. WM6372]
MTDAYEEHDGADPTPVPAATGLFLLAVGGWLLNTTRPWHKPGHPVILGLGWALAFGLLLWGAVLVARCVRTVHGPRRSAYGDGSGGSGNGEAGRTGGNPARPAP